MAADTSPDSLYARMGGEPALRAVIDDFVERLFSDIMIGYLFSAVDPQRLKELEFQHASAFLGGPHAYSGRPLRAAHAQHRIMGGQFARRLQLLRNVFAAHHVPEDVQRAFLAHNESLREQITNQDLGECRD
jgi:hemoglobin